MTDQPKLWAMLIEGPDDIYAMPSEAAAQAQCDILNAHWEKRNADPIGPFLRASACLWPYSAESHAKDMQEHLKDVASLN